MINQGTYLIKEIKRIINICKTKGSDNSSSYVILD